VTVKYPANRPLTDKEEAEIQAMITGDPEAPEVTNEQIAQAKLFSEACPELYASLQLARRGRPKIENPKEVLTIRLAPAAIAYFKSRGRNWRQKLRKDLEKLAGI